MGWVLARPRCGVWEVIVGRLTHLMHQKTAIDPLYKEPPPMIFHKIVKPPV